MASKRRLTSRSRSERYNTRKNDRLNGKLMKSRAHESAPWFTFTTRKQGPGFQHLEGVALVEAQLSEFGTRERLRAQQASLKLIETEEFSNKPRTRSFNRSSPEAT
jgi:hypothetical protein